MFDGLAYEETGLLTRPLLAEQRYERRLAGMGVLARGFPGSRSIAAVIDQVIRNLEGEADIARIPSIRDPGFWWHLRHDAGRLDRIFDEGTGLELLKASDRR